MLKNLLGKLFGASLSQKLRSTDPARWQASLLAQVKDMSAGDPLIGAKVVGKELALQLIDAMQAEHGVHVESLMCAAGALAGYACQAAVRADNLARGNHELGGLSLATVTDGRQFIFGDALNKPLVESDVSVFAVAAGGAQACGCNRFPDLNAVFEHVVSTVGHPEFGVPRLPAGHVVHELPQTYLQRFWPKFSPMLERFCPNPDHWPIAWALAIQHLIAQTQKALDPCVALQVVMESAIPMSKVPVGTV